MYFTSIGTLRLSSHSIVSVRPQSASLYPVGRDDQTVIDSMKLGSRRRYQNHSRRQSLPSLARAS